MDTHQIQQALQTIGWPIAVDGNLGPQTHQAVMDFQRGHGFYPLLDDGYAGPQTQEALARCLANGGHCSTFFTYREYKSKGNGWIKVRGALVVAMDEYRRRYGPTRIVSGYRDPAYNHQVGGASNSQHLYGNANDIPGIASPGAVKNLGLFSGIGYSRSSGKVLHVDVRHLGPNTTNGSPTNPTIWVYA